MDVGPSRAHVLRSPGLKATAAEWFGATSRDEVPLELLRRGSPDSGTRERRELFLYIVVPVGGKNFTFGCREEPGRWALGGLGDGSPARRMICGVIAGPDPDHARSDAAQEEERKPGSQDPVESDRRRPASSHRPREHSRVDGEELPDPSGPGPHSLFRELPHLPHVSPALLQVDVRRPSFEPVSSAHRDGERREESPRFIIRSLGEAIRCRAKGLGLDFEPGGVGREPRLAEDFSLEPELLSLPPRPPIEGPGDWAGEGHLRGPGILARGVGADQTLVDSPTGATLGQRYHHGDPEDLVAELSGDGDFPALRETGGPFEDAVQDRHTFPPMKQERSDQSGPHLEGPLRDGLQGGHAKGGLEDLAPPGHWKGNDTRFIVNLCPEGRPMPLMEEFLLLGLGQAGSLICRRGGVVLLRVRPIAMTVLLQ